MRQVLRIEIWQKSNKLFNLEFQSVLIPIRWLEHSRIPEAWEYIYIPGVGYPKLTLFITLFRIYCSKQPDKVNFENIPLRNFRAASILLSLWFTVCKWVTLEKSFFAQSPTWHSKKLFFQWLSHYSQKNSFFIAETWLFKTLNFLLLPFLSLKDCVFFSHIIFLIIYFSGNVIFSERNQAAYWSLA